RALGPGVVGPLTPCSFIIPYDTGSGMDCLVPKPANRLSATWNGILRLGEKGRGRERRRQVPLQNRVTPVGDLIAVPERGAWMGNRGGCFHTDARELTRRRWVSRRWIVCVLEFRGRHRKVMTPGRYTELFFLDEATALAAGHRPCRECRHADHERFKEAWLHGNKVLGLPAGTSIDQIDAVLHRERGMSGGAKGTFEAAPDSLPDGGFITLPPAPGEALLVAAGRLWRWTPGGYADAGLLPRAATKASVLTPRSTVRAIAAGYAPQRHRSARQARR